MEQKAKKGTNSLEWRQETGFSRWNMIGQLNDAAKRLHGRTADTLLPLSQFNYRSSQTLVAVDWRCV